MHAPMSLARLCLYNAGMTVSEYRHLSEALTFLEQSDASMTGIRTLGARYAGQIPRVSILDSRTVRIEDRFNFVGDESSARRHFVFDELIGMGFCSHPGVLGFVGCDSVPRYISLLLAVDGHVWGGNRRITIFMLW